MSCTIVIEKGHSPVLELTVRNHLSGAYINDAAVTAVLEDESGQEVSGQTWPVTLGHVENTEGIYRALLSPGVNLEVGRRYKARFTVTASGAQGQLEQDVYVVEAGCEKYTDPSSPASPAYRGPSKLQLLNEAEAAHHKLVLGLSPRVIVDQNGERVEYTAANRASLAQYIQQLKRELGLLGAANTGPAGVFF